MNRPFLNYAKSRLHVINLTTKHYNLAQSLVLTLLYVGKTEIAYWTTVF
jgi:hypothetical protein